ncbi:hypothetical protein EVAR_48117_1 [Eumeta japonica]|uniref:Uncharacterized protein n=1 Tax=Eumeta variegata TaxID=151549 RepID=A0A4C2AB62_EUMVA|nr:hypothetical protein EVAR_48117_1 [Eumeta japonica]
MFRSPRSSHWLVPCWSPPPVLRPSLQKTSGPRRPQGLQFAVGSQDEIPKVGPAIELYRTFRSPFVNSTTAYPDDFSFLQVAITMPRRLIGYLWTSSWFFIAGHHALSKVPSMSKDTMTTNF